RELPPNWIVVAVSFGGFATASTLVHEACVFFTLPCTLIIAFWHRSKSSFAALISHSLGAGLALTIVLWATDRPDAVSSTPLIQFGSKSIAYDDFAYDDLWLQKSFSSQLALQTHRLFGQGVRSYFAWSSKLGSSLLLPIFMIYLS